MSIKIIIRRLIFLLVIIFVASTIVFFIPRLSARNPIRQRFEQLAANGGFSPADTEIIIAAYNEKFGLDKPLWQQYLTYMGSLARGDLGVSLFRYTATVVGLIEQALPWSLTLLAVTTVLSFVL